MVIIAERKFPLFNGIWKLIQTKIHRTCTLTPKLPKFVATIPNVTVTAGRDATLPCVVDNIGDYKVAWLHLDRVMLLTIDEAVITLIPRFRVTKEDSNTWTLHIEDVRPEDTGYYVCQVNMEPVINQVGYVKVVVPPKFIDEESSQSHVSVHEENDIRLVCRAQGVPKPKIHWTREDGKAFTVKGSQDSYQIESEELIIKGVTRKDMGAYLCIATNKVPPSISKRIVLDIHFQPVITVPNQLVGAPVGTSVTLECHVAAFPNAVHFWRFNDQLLINSTRQETQEIREGYTTVMKLHLRTLKLEDFGTYVCAAKNSLGEAESNVRLYEIQRSPKVEEEKNKETNHINQIEPVIRPEQRSGDQSMNPWLRPEVDLDVPNYAVDDSIILHGESIPTNPFSGRTSSNSIGNGIGAGSMSTGRTSSMAGSGGMGFKGAHAGLNWKVLWASLWTSLYFASSILPPTTLLSSRRNIWTWVVLSVAVVVLHYRYFVEGLLIEQDGGNHFSQTGPQT